MQSSSSIENTLTNIKNNTAKVNAENAKNNVGRTELDQNAFLQLLMVQLQNQPLHKFLHVEFPAVFVGGKVLAVPVFEKLRGGDALCQQKFAEGRLKVRVVHLAGTGKFDHIPAVPAGDKVGVRPGAHLGFLSGRHLEPIQGAQKFVIHIFSPAPPKPAGQAPASTPRRKAPGREI